MFLSPDALSKSEDRYTGRLEQPMERSQQVLAGVVWLVAAAATLLVNLRPGAIDSDRLILMILLHLVAVGLSVRLPGGLYIGLIKASMVAAALSLGFRQAMLVPVLTVAAAALPGLLYLWTAPALRRYRDLVIYETLYQSGALTLSLLPAGWLYQRMGGGIQSARLTIETAGPMLVFVAVYAAFNYAFEALWLLRARVDATRYARQYLPDLLASGVIAPLFVSPAIGARAHVSLGLSLLGLLPYVVIGFIWRAITLDRLDYSDRIADLRALNSIGQALNARLELDDLLEAIYREIGKLLDTSGFTLTLVEGGELHFPIAYREGRRIDLPSRPLGVGLTDYVATTRQPLLLSHDLPAQAAALGLELAPDPPHSFLAVPIALGDDLLGVISLYQAEREYAFDRNDQRLLETIAAAAAAALQNARLYRQSQQQAAELSSLNEVSSLISSSLEPDTLLETVCEVVTSVMGSQKAAVFLLDPQSRTLSLAGSSGLSEVFRTHSRSIPADGGPRSIAILSGNPVTIEDVRDDPRGAAVRDVMAAEDVRAVLDVPMRSGDRVIGSLAAYFTEPRRFTQSDQSLLETLAMQVAIAVENARLYQNTNSRRRELEILYRTARALTESLSLTSVSRALAESLLGALSVHTAAVLLVDEDTPGTLTTALWLDAAHGAATVDDDYDFSFDLAQAGRLGARLGALETIRLGGDEADAAAAPLAEHFKISAGLMLPLLLHGRLLGVVLAGQHEGARTFTRDDIHMARLLADQATTAIQNARRFETTDIALSRRVDEIAALELISQRITRRLEVHTVIEQVVHAAHSATRADVAELLLLDEMPNMLRVAARVGTSDERALTNWPADEGLTGQAFSTGQTLSVGDVSTTPAYVETRPGIRSELVVPIILDGQRLGVINLESMRPNAFDETHTRFVTNLADHAAIAIQNAQLFESMQRRANEFMTLRAVALDLLSSTDLKETLRVIARETLAHIDAEDIHIYLYDEPTETLSFGTSLWSDGRQDVEFATPRPNGLTATVARTAERLVVSDLANHPLFEDVADDPSWQPLNTMISVPLQRGSEVIGVFNIALKGQVRVSSDLLHFLDLMAVQAAVAISNARLVEETRLGRDRLQTILNSIHDGILLFDMDGRMVLSNPRIEEMFGQPVATLLGERFTTVIERIADTVDSGEVFSLVESLRADPRRTTRRTYRLERPVPRVIDEYSLPVIGPQGMLGRLFVLRDVTREHAIETYRQEMSHMLVHDLRSPLAGVITGLNIAIEQTEFLPPSDTQSMLSASVEVALSSANAMLRLVEEILDVNKLEAGEMSLMREETDLAALARQAVVVLGSMASEAAVTVVPVIPQRLPSLYADGDKLSRVLNNLLDNALRYTPAGGRITLKIQDSPDKVHVTVTDTGSGVPEGERDKVFERFFQGDLSRRQRGAKGSGLGLTFCRLAVEAHGGRIWVDSGPEGGAAFHFTLPRVEPEEPGENGAG